MKQLKQALLFFALFFSVAFVNRQEPKKFKFLFTDQEVGAIWQVVEQSNASHQQVKAVQDLISKQYNEQLPKDSTKTKK